MVGLEDFHYFSDIFGNCASWACCIFDIKIIRTELMKAKLCMINCYRNRTIKLFTFPAAWLAFSLLSKKSCKIWQIFSLLVFIFDACSNSTGSSNHKTISVVFLARNLIFLTAYNVIWSRLYNARYSLLKSTIEKIVAFFLLGVVY